MTKKSKKRAVVREEKKENLLNSRRDFFKKSALGAGGLALAGSGTLAGCAPQNSNGGMKTTRAGGSSTNEWYAPPEINLTKDSNKALATLPNFKALQGDPEVPFDTMPHTLIVDKNITENTPSGVDPLFGYNGTVPGPTFRIRGSQDLEVLLINSLSGNNGYWAVKSDARIASEDPALNDQRVNPDTLDWQIDHHLYGPHQQHVTNLHTHGLHVSPGQFKSTSGAESDIVHSDNVLLRVIPFEDYVNRVVEGNGPPLMDNEIVGYARYKFHLPRPDGTPHYAGTHWYHPHPHGATFDQVAGGMAGFLIVEGEIDDFIADQFKDNYYKELPLLVQRVFVGGPTEGETPVDKGTKKKDKTSALTVNGQRVGGTDPMPNITVQSNQVIRLRVLNGSVDGKGYIRFMVCSGTTAPSLINPNSNLYTDSRCSKNGNLPKNASASAKRWFTDQVSDNRICLNNIAYDGINLIDKDGNYTDMPSEWCTIGVANRADFLVNIPADAQPDDVFTIWGQEMNEAVDADGAKTTADNLQIATFTVGSATGGGAAPVPPMNADGSLNIPWAQAGKIEDMLLPIKDAEITIDDNSETTDAYLPPSPTNLQGDSITMKASGNSGSAIRARRLVYSGFGHASVLGAAFDPNETVTTPDGVTTTLHTMYNAMLIDGKKYGSDTSMHQGWDAAQHKMKVGTAEEWSIYNYSMTVYMKDSTADNTDESNYVVGVPSYKNANGSTIPGLGANSLLRSKGVHHPFHIHQNPFYVRSIQDYEGNELLPLDDNGDPIPRWQDTVYLPHNGGRVIFRSRFWDYVGKYVNHCHLLQHEDWGMMQAIEVVDGVNTKANYIPLPVTDGLSQNVFPALSLKQMFTLDIGWVKDILASSPAKMLCYDPGTTTFFHQNPITELTAKKVDASYFTNTAAQNQTVNVQNVGYLLTPVPLEDTPYPGWNNDFKSSEQII